MCMRIMRCKQSLWPTHGGQAGFVVSQVCGCARTLLGSRSVVRLVPSWRSASPAEAALKSLVRKTGSKKAGMRYGTGMPSATYQPQQQENHRAAHFSTGPPCKHAQGPEQLLHDKTVPPTAAHAVHCLGLQSKHGCPLHGCPCAGPCCPCHRSRAATSIHRRCCRRSNCYPWGSGRCCSCRCRWCSCRCQPCAFCCRRHCSCG